MKKLIALLLLTGLISCEKEPIFTSCYTCTSVMVTSVSAPVTGYPETVTSITMPCGWTASEAGEFERSMTNTTTAASGSLVITVKTTCRCVKK